MQIFLKFERIIQTYLSFLKCITIYFTLLNVTILTILLLKEVWKIEQLFDWLDKMLVWFINKLWKNWKLIFLVWLELSARTSSGLYKVNSPALDTLLHEEGVHSTAVVRSMRTVSLWFYETFACKWQKSKCSPLQGFLREIIVKGGRTFSLIHALIRQQLFNRLLWTGWGVPNIGTGFFFLVICI